MALASVANWSCNSIVVFLFSVIVSIAGTATFSLFALFCTFGLVFALRWAPETKGRSLEDLGGELADPVSVAA